EADLTRLHGLSARRHSAQVLADRDPRPGGVGRHVAVEADPVDGAVGALLIPVGTLVELGGEAGELELELVDGLADADHLVGDIKLLRNQRDHAKYRTKHTHAVK